MIKFEFSKYMDRFMDHQKLEETLKKQDDYINRLQQEELAGWYQEKIEKSSLDKIVECSKRLRSQSDYLLVIATGGSYMGSFSFYEMFKEKRDSHHLIYLGNNLSSKSIRETLEFLEDKNFCVNVISKSGNTLEIKILYQFVRELLLKRYREEEVSKRIVVTTEEKESFLYQEIEKYHYQWFEFPKNIGGRYSLTTVAHLLPLSYVSFDIKKLIDGFYDGKQLLNEAYYYAAIRNQMYLSSKYIENFSVYEPCAYYYTEFLKQLFAESEGKEKKGILPISTVNTRDLHSLGQYLQDGSNIVFETVIDIEMKEDVTFSNISIKNLNNSIKESVLKSHYQEDTPSILLQVDYDLYSFGQLSMFFMLAAVFSSYLLDINPFDQPGVEKYKKELDKIINQKNSSSFSLSKEDG